MVKSKTENTKLIFEKCSGIQEVIFYKKFKARPNQCQQK